MLTIENLAGDIVVIKAGGNLSALDVAKYANRIKREVALFNPGFNLITDISKLEPGDKYFLPLLREVMEMVGKKGPARVFRVVDGSEIDAQFDYAWDSEHVTYEVTKVKSVDEAMKQLASSDS